MNFDLPDRHAAARDGARQFARERVAPRATAIDTEASVPSELLASAVALVTSADDALAVVVVTEALASVSASVALAAATTPGRLSLGLAGLRGAPTPDDSPRGALVVSAVALGLARAALDRALADLKEAAAHPGEGDKPHWAVADAATELDAAQLLTYRAATLPDGDAQSTAAAMARLLATAAATRAVDVALRLAGPDGFAQGSVLERLARDARAITLVGGGEDAHRATAAAGLLPG